MDASLVHINYRSDSQQKQTCELSSLLIIHSYFGHANLSMSGFIKKHKDKENLNIGDRWY